jgi:hypothetical protein
VQEQGRTRGDGTCTAADVLAAACPGVSPGTRAHHLAIQLLDYHYLTTEQTQELFHLLFQPDAARDFQVSGAALRTLMCRPAGVETVPGWACGHEPASLVLNLRGAGRGSCRRSSRRLCGCATRCPTSCWAWL